jgi:hypothetical protein
MSRSFVAGLLALWLVLGPVGAAWASHAATPCDSMGSATQPLTDDCCGESMDAAACLSACISGTAALAVPRIQTARFEVVRSAIPSLSARYATVLAPPDIAPPKSFVS